VERIIVRRGRFLTYERLRRTFGSDPHIEIIWDRRRGEQDALTEQAIAERRSRPPVEWEQQHYIFTTDAGARSGKTPKSDER
jgi:hypothetical protein